MAKRTTRTTNRGNSAETSQASNDSVTYTSGPAAAVDQATDRGGPDTRLGDAEVERTLNESMASEPSEEEIRMRAYRRYLERGGRDGQDFDDWLAAERELKQPG